MPFDPKSSVRYLKGIGPSRAKILTKAGICTLEDLVYYFPRKYQDRTHIIPIKNIEIGQTVTISGRVLSSAGRRSYWRRGFDIFEISIGDDTGRIFVVWFNQPYLRSYFKEGGRVILYGKAELYKDRIQMSNPEFEVLENGTDSTDSGKIIPIYSLPQGISQKVFRKMIKTVLDSYVPKAVEVLPFDIRLRHKLDNIAKSLVNIHFPETQEARIAAYSRLSFEEFFLYQVPLILRKLKRGEKKGIAFKPDEKFICDFVSSLPFALTDSQKHVFGEILSDMRKVQPMQRLLQGDVGSGKTIVALLSGLVAVSSGYQVVIMAPTEILAQQHFLKISELLLDTVHPVVMPLSRHVDRSTGRHGKIKVGLLTSSLSDKERERMLKAISDGEFDIVIGTHSVIQEDVKFRKLGLVVIDEQHKFGVSQRALLSKKAVNPDILIMTATPIPRTLSMTLYGDLDVSVITELPRGRKKIITKVFDTTDKLSAYKFVESQVELGRQAYVICPVIEENPKIELSAAKTIYNEFSSKIFKDFRVGLIHGRLNKYEQEEVMRKFREKELDILVATIILEVGIDVANATVMLIENAQRYGLSQLHQMRGRIGRGELESYCLLIDDSNAEGAADRLKVFVENSDGFKIAEEDLKLRGPGEFFGERQHGLTELKIADPLRQFHLLKAAREEVVRLLKDDPKLEKRPNIEIKNQLYKRFPEFERFLNVA